MSRRLRVCVLILLAGGAMPASAQNAGGNKTDSAPKPAASAAGESKPDSAVEQRVESYLRNLYAWDSTFELKIGPVKPSPVSDLLTVPVTITKGGQSDSAVVYVSKDSKFIFRGELADMTVDPFAEARSKLRVGDSPSMGPKDAKVTLIEFADFECPSCRELDRILRDFMPNHPDIRLVYKSFPLIEIHPWAMTAAIAAQCTYQQDQAKFWKIHDALFDAQDVISPANAWDKMMDLATQLGLNVDSFKTCMASPEAKAQVEQTMAEGRAVNVTGTPTTFINGRQLVGPDATQLEQLTTYQQQSLN